MVHYGLFTLKKEILAPTIFESMNFCDSNFAEAKILPQDYATSFFHYNKAALNL